MAKKQLPKVQNRAKIHTEIISRRVLPDISLLRTLWETARTKNTREANILHWMLWELFPSGAEWLCRSALRSEKDCVLFECRAYFVIIRFCVCARARLAWCMIARVDPGTTMPLAICIQFYAHSKLVSIAAQMYSCMDKRVSCCKQYRICFIPSTFQIVTFLQRQ